MNPIRIALPEEPRISVIVYAPRRAGYERYVSDVVVFGADATVVAEGFVGVPGRGRAGKASYVRGIHTPSVEADIAIAKAVDRALRSFAEAFARVDKEKEVLKNLRSNQERALQTIKEALRVFSECGERAGDSSPEISSALNSFFDSIANGKGQ